MKKIVSAVVMVLLLVGVAPLSSLAAFQFPSKEHSVSAYKEWRVTLSQSVDPRTVTNQTVYVVDAQGNSQQTMASVVVGEPRVILVAAPQTGYEAGASYTLRVTDSIRSQKGKKLTERVEMKFSIQASSTQDIVLGTWNANYMGIGFMATFNEDYTSVVNFGGDDDHGVYSIEGEYMTMTVLGLTRTGKVDRISKDEFTITSASGNVMRFTR